MEARWDAIAIIEELNIENPKVKNREDLWGSSYFLDKSIGKTHYIEKSAASRIPKLRKSQISEIRRNYFVSEISRVARYALP